MLGELLVLRLVHVLGGIFWVGGMMYVTFFLAPALAQAGPAAGPVMAAMQQRRMFLWLPVIAVITILAGIRLMMISSMGFQSAWFASTSGKTYLGSAVLSVLALILGLAIVRPTMMRTGRLMAEMAGADDARRSALQGELAALRQRSTAMQRLVTWMLILAAAGMAVARYL